MLSGLGATMASGKFISQRSAASDCLTLSIIKTHGVCRDNFLHCCIAFYRRNGLWRRFSHRPPGSGGCVKCYVWWIERVCTCTRRSSCPTSLQCSCRTLRDGPHFPYKLPELLQCKQLRLLFHRATELPV